MVEKAVATVGRDSRKEAVARVKSSAFAQAHLCRNRGLWGSGGKTTDMSHLLAGSKAMVNKLPLAGQPWRTPHFIANWIVWCTSRRKRRRKGWTPARSNTRNIHLRSTLGYAQEKSGSRTPGFFGTAGPKGGGCRVNFTNVICYNTLGDASLRKVNALDGAHS